MRIEEKSLILPTLYIIERDGSVSTSELIAELTAVFHPTGEDAEILAGRNDTKFSQKVRNLKSHRETNKMDVYTNFSSGGRYTLTEEGARYLEDNREQVEYLFSNQFPYEEVAAVLSAVNRVQGKKKRVYIYSEEDMVSEGRKSRRDSVVRERSRKLREAAIDHYTDDEGKIRCAVCGFCFEERYGEIGRRFMEIHHEKPVFQYSDAGFSNYIGDAVLRVKPLCPNCHRMIHRDPKRPMTIEELKRCLR